MEFDDDARLDSSQVSDQRGSGGGTGRSAGGLGGALGGVLGGMGKGKLAGGGGIVALIIVAITLFAGGGGGDPALVLNGFDVGGSAVEDNTDLTDSCQTGADASQRQDCRILAVVNSVQKYWGGQVRGYRESDTVFFSGRTSTGCGAASASTGPFYCPPDAKVYIDLTFYDTLKEQFGATGGPFAQAYVISHEYGHHVQDLQGTISRGQDGTTGATSSSVRIELQADCYAGMWAAAAVGDGFITNLSQADIDDGLDAAAAVGDDRIQEAVQGRADPESFTHGSSEQRQRWFMVGFNQKTFAACDTFAARTL